MARFPESVAVLGFLSPSKIEPAKFVSDISKALNPFFDARR